MSINSSCLPQFSKVLRETSGKLISILDGDKVKSSHRQYSSTLPEELCRQFSLDEIKATTNNFHEDMIIGEGTYGDPIYRGIIDDRTLPVAVKCFYNCSQEFIRGGGIREFRTEVKFLCQLRHPNLVSLIGFCDEQDNKILLYEYSGKGTLYDHINGVGHDPLPWKQRLEICVGAARGLHYLHTGAKRAVIHRNINSRNILLDNECASKLSEFGYSMMVPLSKSDASIKIEKYFDGYATGRCYIHPEEVQGQPVTDKSDVYSFGVVLFEVLCGSRESVVPNIRHPQSYELWKCLQNGTIYDIIDPYLKGTIAPECFIKFMQIVWSCICNKEDERLGMGEVELMLEHALELQNKTDSEIKSIGSRSQCIYEDASFSAYDAEYSDTCSGGYLSDSDSSLCR